MKHKASLSEKEKHQILVEWNQTYKNFPLEKRAIDLFEEQVEKNSQKPAIAFEDVVLTYGELNERVNQLAHYLLKLNVKPEELVGICLPRSIEMVIAELAVMKSGAAFVPLDPNLPEQRLNLMMEDTKIKYLITNKTQIDLFPEYSGLSICIDQESADIQKESSSNPGKLSNCQNIAYLIYTSGSTGNPKGVMIEHRGLTNFLLGVKEVIGTSEPDIRLTNTAFCFDMSIAEVFSPLTMGALVIISSEKARKDVSLLLRLIEKFQVNMLTLTPTNWMMLFENGWSGYNEMIAITGGEQLNPDLLKLLCNGCKTVWNAYGPTEITIGSSFDRIDPDEEIITIGKPLPNVTYYILDENLQPVPIGVMGTLYIGGVGVARGYLNQPKLTEEKFIPDPFSRVPNAKIYNSGDLAKFLPDGRVVCLGRADNQVKIRGHRLELSEIETILRTLTNIREAVVLAREDRAGDKRLVAYVRTDVDMCDKNGFIETMRQILSEKLPKYMLPSAFVIMKEFPLTASGKLDTKSLPKPEFGHFGRKIILPNTDTERILHKIWLEVLNLEDISINDDFFDVGGDSILTTKLLSKIRKKLGVNITIPDFFTASTIAKLASRIDSGEQHVQQCLIALNNEGAMPPLFCIHAMDGNVFYYIHLARIFEGMRRFYGIQSQGLIQGLKPHKTIQEMADAYIQEIKSIQPEGPYHLLGYSSGGLLCIEMAHQLKHHGDAIGSLILIDTFVEVTWPENLKDNIVGQLEVLCVFARIFARITQENFAIKVEEFQKFKSLLEGLQYVFKIFVEHGILPDDATIDDLKRSFEVFIINLQAEKNYCLPKIEEDILLIEATDHSGLIEISYDAITRGKIQIYRMEGDHFSWMEADHTYELSELIRKKDFIKGTGVP